MLVWVKFIMNAWILGPIWLPKFDHIRPYSTHTRGNDCVLQSQVSQVRWRQGQWAYRSKNDMCNRLELRKTEKVARGLKNSKILSCLSSWKTYRPGSAVGLVPGGFGVGLGVRNLVLRFLLFPYGFPTLIPWGVLEYVVPQSIDVPIDLSHFEPILDIFGWILTFWGPPMTLESPISFLTKPSPKTPRQVSQLSKLCQIGEGTTGESGAEKVNVIECNLIFSNFGVVSNINLYRYMIMYLIFSTRIL